MAMSKPEDLAASLFVAAIFLILIACFFFGFLFFALIVIPLIRIAWAFFRLMICTITEFREDYFLLKGSLIRADSKAKKSEALNKYANFIKECIMGSNSKLGHPYYEDPFNLSESKTRGILGVCQIGIARLGTPLVRTAPLLAIQLCNTFVGLYYTLTNVEKR